MSGPESAPEEAKHLSRQPVDFTYGNIAELEQLAWSDVRGLTIIDDDRVPLPLVRIYALADGSSDPDGKFGFSTTVIPHEESRDQVAAGLLAMATEADGQATGRRENEYLIESPEDLGYLVSMDGDRRTLNIRSLGSSATVQTIGEASLRHGVNGYKDSLDDYLEFNSAVLSTLYETLDTPVEGVIVMCEPSVRTIAGETEEETGRLVRLADIAGYAEIKQQIQDLADEMRGATKLDAWGVERRQGLLLYGPPGTGKTTLVEAFANEIGAQLKVVTSDQIYDMWLGNSEKNMAEVFDEAAKARGPYVLLFDELESIISSKDGHGAHQHVAGIYKQRSARLTQENPNVIQAATTNDTNRSDPAILRSGRFDVRLEVPLPDQTGRSEIFALYADKFEERSEYPVFGEVDFGSLAAATEGYSGADIEAAVKGVVIGRALHHMRTDEIKPPATTNEILAAISSKEGEDPDHARFERPGNYL